MNRYGFKKIYLDSQIKSIFVYTGKLEKLVNYFERCKVDLLRLKKLENSNFKKYYKIIYSKLYFYIFKKN